MKAKFINKTFFKFLVAIVFATLVCLSISAKDIGKNSGEKPSEEIKNGFKTIGDGLAEICRGVGNGLKSAVETMQKYKTVTGMLKVSGSGDKMKFLLKADDTTYTLELSSKDEVLKLSGYKNHKVKIRGFLDKESCKINVKSYLLAEDG